MNDTDWREAYRQVLFEAEPENLQMSIEAAHEAVNRRICTVWDVQPPDMGELNQLAYASYILGLLKQHQQPFFPSESRQSRPSNTGHSE